MDSAQFERVNQLFEACRELSQAERDARLTLDAGDAEIEREVRDLLAAWDRSESFLEQPALQQHSGMLKGLLEDCDTGALAPGTRLGPYEIVSRIGAGGMGEVYRAHDSRLQRDVAIKVCGATFTERFEREVRAIAALNHPHICQIFDVGHNYLVMEFIEGAPLGGPLPLAKAVDYAGQILEALDAAHREGFVHRDLKPANILITARGIKLLDFGLAKRRAPLDDGAPVSAAISREGQISGTLQYVSPEQLQGEEATASSDLFSFGCVLYEMLSGKRAFTGASNAAIIAAILEREPEPLATPTPLDRVIRTCLAKDPRERFQNALDTRRALEWAMEELPGPARRRTGLAVILTSACIGLLGGAAVVYGLVYSQRRAPAPPVNATPVVVLMDTSAPEGVYDPVTRNNSGTNGDDLTEALRDFPVALHKETVGATWDREDQVLKQVPDLIIIHRSAFILAMAFDFLGILNEAGVPTAAQANMPHFGDTIFHHLDPLGRDKLELFLGYIAGQNPKTRFLVYSRGWDDQPRRNWQQLVELRFPQLKGRVTTFSLGPSEATNFHDPGALARMRQGVSGILHLQSTEKTP